MERKEEGKGSAGGGGGIRSKKKTKVPQKWVRKKEKRAWYSGIPSHVETGPRTHCKKGHFEVESEKKALHAADCLLP